MPKLIIVDPSLYSVGGHEFAMDLFLCREAQSRGYDPIVLSHKAFKGTAPFPYQAIFEDSLYSQAGKSEQADKKSYQRRNKAMFKTLSSTLLSADIPKDSVVLVHTACASMLSGMAAWLFRLKRPDLRIRLVIRWGMEHFRYSESSGVALFRHALQAWDKVPGDVQFFVDSSPLQRHFVALLSRRFPCTPIGVDFSDMPEIPAFQEKSSYSFVFAGAPRMSKGGQLLASAIIDYLIDFPEDKFHIHLLGLNQQERAFFTPLPASCVHFEHRYLGGKSYVDYLMSGDVILVPYSPKYYHLRTSHIFIEALGLGRAVIAAGHAWKTEVLDGFDVPCGVVMKEWTAEGLTAAMREFRKRAPVICQNAIANSAAVRAQHNPTAWMDCVI